MIADAVGSGSSADDLIAVRQAVRSRASPLRSEPGPTMQPRAPIKGMPVSDQRGPSGSRGWIDVDAGDPSALLDYLRDMSVQDWAQDLRKTTYRHLRTTPGMRLLDVGCGRGEVVLALADIVGAAGSVTGIDFSEAMVATAREAGRGRSNVAFERADAHDLPYPEASFDGCRAERVLEHVRDARRTLGEMRRVCRPGGRVVAAEPDWDTVTVSIDDLDLANRLVWHHTTTFSHGAIGRDLYGLFRGLGFSEIVVEPAVIPFIDLDSADQVLQVRRYGIIAAEAGAAPRADALRWRDQLEAAAREGRFFASITGFVVSGCRA